MTPIVRNLLLINITIFFAQRFWGMSWIDSLGLRSVLSDYFRPYQFFTHLFVHTSLGHLFSNMFSLFIFGPVLERTMHAKRFISFYIMTGLGAAALYAGVQYAEVSKLKNLCEAYGDQPNPQDLLAYLQHFSQGTYDSLSPFVTHFFNHPDDPACLAESRAIVSQLYRLKADITTVGASGSVFGIFTAFSMLFPNKELFLFFIPFPVKVKYVVAIYGAYELYAGIIANPTDNVAHAAHLGGILFAYLFVRWSKKLYYH